MGGEFVGTQDVTITAADASSAWYKIGDVPQVPFNVTATFTIGADMNVGETVTVSWSDTDGKDKTQRQVLRISQKWKASLRNGTYSSTIPSLIGLKSTATSMAATSATKSQVHGPALL